MNRRGAALFVALVVVLAGGLVVVLATAIAASEIRAGTAWLEQAHSLAQGVSAAARSRPKAESLLAGLLPGESAAVNGTVGLTRLTDSVALLTIQAQSRLATEMVRLLVRIEPDSTGLGLRPSPGARIRYHPVP